MSAGDRKPIGEDWIGRALAKLREQVQSLRSTVASIDAIRAQVTFLATQTSIDESAPATFATVATSPAIDTGWSYQPFDPDRDVSRPVTTSSTGKLAIQLGCYLYLRATDGATALGSVGLEVLSGDEATQIRTPGIGDGNLTTLKAPLSGAVSLQCAMNGHSHILTLDPTTPYVLRTRRMWAAGAGAGTAPDATTGWQGTSLQVTKLGM